MPPRPVAPIAELAERVTHRHSPTHAEEAFGVYLQRPRWTRLRDIADDCRNSEWLVGGLLADGAYNEVVEVVDQCKERFESKLASAALADPPLESLSYALHVGFVAQAHASLTGGRHDASEAIDVELCRAHALGALREAKGLARTLSVLQASRALSSDGPRVPWRVSLNAEAEEEAAQLHDLCEAWRARFDGR